MNTGQVISGIGHAGLILWALLGGLLFPPDEPPEVAVTEVSLMSGAEFAEMVAAVPPQPEAPAVETPPEPAAEAPPPEPEPAVEPPPAPEPTPEPVAEPRPEPLPDPAPEAAPPEPQPLPVAEDPVSAPVITARPRPRPAERVASLPTEEPPPELATAPDAVPEVAPEPAPETPVVEEERPPAAPEEAGTELLTEANREEATNVASGSVRPRPRPARIQTPPEAVETASAEVLDPAPRTPEEAPAETPPEDAAESAADADAIAAALAEAGAAITSSAVPSGPPMTAGEKDGLRVAVGKCWNLGSSSTDALSTTVTIGVSMTPEGKPSAVRLISSSGPSDIGANIAFEAARRAVLNCGRNGFPLPPEKYDQWSEIEMVFNPDGMRLR